MTDGVVGVADPHAVAPPAALLAALPLALFAFKLLKLVRLYKARVGATSRQTLAAALAGLALSHTIAWAVLKGVVTSNEPFFRTPKLARQSGVVTALRSATSELLMLPLLVGAVIALGTIGPDLQCTELSLWKAMPLIQATPYAAAVLVSALSAFPLPAAWLGKNRLKRRQLVAGNSESAVAAEAVSAR